MNLAYAAGQIESALRLARREPDAMRGFDVGVDGFWNSFWAALICYPGFLALSLPGQEAFPWLRETAGYLVGWAVFPLLMIPLTRQLNLERRYVPLIVAANWASVLQTLVFVGGVTLSRVLPPPLGGFTVLAVTVLVLLYEWHVVRTALGTTAAIAAGVTALDLVAGLFVDNLFAG